MVQNDKKIILSVEQAISLLPDGKYIHNFRGGGSLFFGCDYDRADAVEALEKATAIEIGGENSMAMKHPIAVWKDGDGVSFFAADMARVDTFLAERSKP